MTKFPELTEHQRDLIAMGLCPFCEKPVKGWKTPFGAFAPEAWATLREQGIDPSNGHHESCLHKHIRLE